MRETGLFVQWIWICCKCRKEFITERDPVFCDLDKVPVPFAAIDDKRWQTDGLGGWLCPECFSNYKG